MRNRFIYWTPRILGLLFIAFLMLFSLDVFMPGASATDILLGLLIHNIPALSLLIILLISWRYEIVGGLFFILAGVLYMATIITSIITSSPHEWYMLVWTLPISAPALLIGVLFFIGWKQKKSKST